MALWIGIAAAGWFSTDLFFLRIELTLAVMVLLAFMFADIMENK